jgi:choline dehydrogenase
LRPACDGRANLQVWTQAQVARLELAPAGRRQLALHRGAGAQGRRDAQRASAAAEVILSAGSIGSVQLLQLSGLGPGALLQRYGIEVLHDAPGVGANLQDHLQIRAVFKVQGVKTLNTQASTWWGKAGIALEYAVTAQRADEHGPQPAGGLHPQ